MPSQAQSPNSLRDPFLPPSAAAGVQLCVLSASAAFAEAPTESPSPVPPDTTRSRYLPESQHNEGVSK